MREGMTKRKTRRWKVVLLRSLILVALLLLYGSGLAPSRYLALLVRQTRARNLQLDSFDKTSLTLERFSGLSREDGVSKSELCSSLKDRRLLPAPQPFPRPPCSVSDSLLSCGSIPLAPSAIVVRVMLTNVWAWAWSQVIPAIKGMCWVLALLLMWMRAGDRTASKVSRLARDGEVRVRGLALSRSVFLRQTLADTTTPRGVLDDQRQCARVVGREIGCSDQRFSGRN